MQLGVPSPSVSVSGLPQPHTPGAILLGSFGQTSMQLAVPSWSVSVSGLPQPHWPGAILLGSFGPPSSPLPSGDQFDPSHWAQILALTPPALLKRPPTINLSL